MRDATSPNSGRPSWWLGLASDLRQSLRSLPRDARLWVLASLTLGLGVGANLALYLFLAPVLLSPLPYSAPERLTYLWQTDERNNEPFAGLSIPDLRDFQTHATTFEKIGAYSRQSMALRFDPEGTTERMTGLNASHELFQVLDLQPALGRLIVESDDRPGAAPVALLGDRAWRSQFGADPDVIGRELVVDGTRHRIVGVLPPAHGAGLEAPVWVPLMPAQSAFIEERGTHGIVAVARLRPGATLAEADAEAAAIGKRLQEEYPVDNVGRGARVVPMHAHLVRSVQAPMLLLALLTGCVLLLAGVNVGMLLFARASARAGELAVRAGLGATPRRLLRLLATEQMLLGLTAGAVGLLFAAAALQVALAWNPLSERFAAVQPSLGAGVIAATLGLSVLLALLFGALPAWVLARRATRALAGSRRGDRHEAVQSRRLLLGVQSALAVMLVASAALLARGFMHTVAVEPGFAHTDTLRVGVALPAARYPFPGIERYPDWPEVRTAYDSMLAAVRELPYVAGVALAQNHPLEGGWTTRVTRPDRPAEGAPVEWTLRAISPGYAEVAGVPVQSGRAISRDDHRDAPLVVMINAAAAQRWFPGEDPIGKTVNFWGRDRTVVGVLGNVRFAGLTEDVPDAVYPPIEQAPFSEFSLLVRVVDGAPVDALRSIEQAIARAVPDAALFGQGQLGDLVDVQLAPRRFALWLVLALAGAALLLAVAGLYGVVANDVRRRRREFGVRRALGAGAGNVLSLAARRPVVAVALGSVAGLVLTLVAGRWLSTYLDGIDGRDPVALGAALALFLGAAVLTALASARPATRVEPMQVLRDE